MHVNLKGLTKHHAAILVAQSVLEAKIFGPEPQPEQVAAFAADLTEQLFLRLNANNEDRNGVL